MFFPSKFTAQVLPFFCAVAMSACSAGMNNAGINSAAPLTLEGMLLLKGNEPFIKPVLQTDADGQWQLSGLNRDQMTQWQRQRVQVTGTVVNSSNESTLSLPHLHVTALVAAP